MAVRFTDAEIAVLLAESKPLPEDWRARLRLRARKQMPHEQVAKLQVVGSAGHRFWIHLRNNLGRLHDWTAILTVELDSGTEFRLRRYNGPSHEHPNPLEGDLLPLVPHIHQATERYQRYAEGTEERFATSAEGRYGTLDGALDCLIADCGFSIPPVEPLPLFGPGGAP